MINVKKHVNKIKQAFIATSNKHYVYPLLYQPTNATRIHNQYSLLSMICKPSVALLMGIYSTNIYAVILSDNSERRVELRYGSASNSNAVASYPYINSNANKSDRLQSLIEQKQREYNSTHNSSFVAVNMSYQMWLNSNAYRAAQVAHYQRYLISQLGAQNVPPLDQLLTTARSWERCGYEPYQLPPQELWSNIVPTLQLYSHLKNQGVLPFNTEIRSVYRSPNLNDCAGGASGSKHMTAGAMDIWVPEYGDNNWRINSLQDKLCDFWQYQGSRYEFGLGIYPTGAIHLDTQGYRKWGVNYSTIGSSCRY